MNNENNEEVIRRKEEVTPLLEKIGNKFGLVGGVEEGTRVKEAVSAHEKNNNRELSTALARTMLRDGDTCSCIDVGKEEILWSSNRTSHGSESYSYAEEVFGTFVAFVSAMNNNNEQEKEDCEQELLRRAIIKDCKWCGKLSNKHKRFLDLGSGGENKVLNSLRNSLRESFTNVKNAEDIKMKKNKDLKETFRKERDELVGKALKKRCEFISFLTRLQRSRQENISHTYFWSLLGVHDVKTVLREISGGEGEWAERILFLLRKENSLRIVLGLDSEKKHAEQRILEEKSKSHDSMREFLGEGGKDSSWTAVSLHLCLFCEMTLSSCEKALGLKEKAVERFGSSGKCYASYWKSFCLEKGALRDDIRNQWNIIGGKLLEDLTGAGEENELWMEQTTITTDFTNKYRSTTPDI